MRMINAMGFLCGALTVSAVAYQATSVQPVAEQAAVVSAQREHVNAAAMAGNCYTISELDARAYCLAKVHQSVGRCEAIRRQDLRAMCKVEVGK